MNEPVHVSTILPDLLVSIEQPVENRAAGRRQRAFAATRDFTRRSPKRHRMRSVRGQRRGLQGRPFEDAE